MAFFPAFMKTTLEPLFDRQPDVFFSSCCPLGFVVGPGGTTLAGCSRWAPGQTGVEPPTAPTLCCNGGYAPLGLVSDGFALRLEDLECEGDESCLCGSAPATGQAIVATGVLDWEDGRRLRMAASRAEALLARMASKPSGPG